jgi:hypothetical protein
MRKLIEASEIFSPAVGGKINTIMLTKVITIIGRITVAAYEGEFL